ncbi:SDR family NAD(P)-dependent oxidoreductase [Flammeovirga pacifica]|uniref:Short-chain dehydrogenase n=1 Tax=Flammeovirga pacifica TaxID=915059 RepID=A0A1S1YTI9_FLAPC|nr:SDR family oxidoreductase [Flammeovirga pacifica]OHX64173.1 short-chain dehydrogenase [Flammeovirga pacifica]
MKNIALITGASSGIGKEFAKIHAERGGDLVVVARSENKLLALKKSLEEKYNTKVVIITKDLSDLSQVEEVYQEVKSQEIEIDYLINNAGFGGLGKFHERDWSKDLAMINLNITALTALTRFFLDDMVKKNKGKILNVSSTASFMPGPLQAVYYATKAYVTFFSNAIAQELHDTNITVTTLMPGATETGIGSSSGMDKTELFKDTASPYTVALDGYNGMIKGKLDVISGLTFSQKIMMKAVPLTPKKIILKQIYTMQQASE